MFSLTQGTVLRLQTGNGVASVKEEENDGELQNLHAYDAMSI